MHIGFLTPEYPTPENPEGGLANYIRKVAFALVKKGHHVSVVVLSDKNSVSQDGSVHVYFVKRASPFWYLGKVRYVGALFVIIFQILSFIKVERKVREVHKSKPFDILQASSYGAPGYTLRKNGQIPVVCRVSSYTPLYRSAYGRQRKIQEYISDWLEVRQVLDADASFAPSKLMADAFLKMEAADLEVIRSPVDIDIGILNHSFYNNYLKNQSYFLFFGTLSRIKGTDLLATVIPQIIDEHKEIEFVFVGRDDGLPCGQKVFDYILEKCANYKSNLFYYPPLPKHLLYPVISNALGVLMPSRVDNYPNACLEAQMFGVPVVGTTGSSLDEMLMEGKTGFIASNSSCDSLKDAIKRLLSQTPSERKRMKLDILKHIECVKAEDRVSQLVDFYVKTIDRFHSNKL